MEKINRKGKFSYNLLIVLIFFVILIGAVILFYPNANLNGIPSENQENNQPVYNPYIPPVQEDEPIPQKDWSSIIYEIENQIKIEASKLNIPVSKVTIFTESSGKPSRMEVQLEKGWENSDGNSADLIDIFLTKSSQIIKNLGLKVTSVDVDSETEMIYINIE